MPAVNKPMTATAFIASHETKLRRHRVAASSGGAAYVEATWGGTHPTLTPAPGGSASLSADWSLANDHGSHGVTVDGSGVLSFSDGLYLVNAFLTFSSWTPSTAQGLPHSFTLNEAEILGGVDFVASGEAATSLTGLYWTTAGADTLTIQYWKGTATSVNLSGATLFIVKLA